MVMETLVQTKRKHQAVLPDIKRNVSRVILRLVGHQPPPLRMPGMILGPGPFQ